MALQMPQGEDPLGELHTTYQKVTCLECGGVIPLVHQTVAFRGSDWEEGLFGSMQAREDSRNEFQYHQLFLLLMRKNDSLKNLP